MSDKVEFDLEDLDDLKDLLGEERQGASFNFQKVFAHLVLKLAVVSALVNHLYVLCILLSALCPSHLSGVGQNAGEG